MATLFTLTTSRVRLVFSGPVAAVQDARETVRVTPAPGASGVRLDVQGVVADEAPLRIDEETTVDVWLESLDGAPVALRHADPVVVAALAPARNGTIVHGPVRFGSQAGRSRFAVLSGGVAEATVEVMLAPTKASWADVQTMREHVEAAGAGLALAALRPAGLDLDGSRGPASSPAFVALLRAATPRLVGALAAIARDPETVPARPLATVRSAVLRRASGETLRALRRSAVWPERLPGRPVRPTLDTPAHRWLAAGLDGVLARAAALRSAEASRPPSARRTAVALELARLGDALSRARRVAPLVAACGPAPAAPPLALRARPAYAAAAEALAALRGALRLADGDTRVSGEDLSALYESWAALETVAAFARAVGAASPARPFGALTVGADVRLGRGAGHAVRLVGERGEVGIVRQPRFAGPPALLVQIPDLLVTVRVPGRSDERIVLDAKYRVAPGGPPNAAAPPGDALGALHRYRDAIVGPDGRALVQTAAVLFPARVGAAFGASPVWTSLVAIGVGAIPLLPGATGWLDAFAERVLSGTGGGA